MSIEPGKEKGSMGDMVESVSGGLMNIILGALILWVGQTTFEHAGQLASVDKRFEGVGHQFETVDHKFATVEKVYGEFPLHPRRRRQVRPAAAQAERAGRGAATPIGCA